MPTKKARKGVVRQPPPNPKKPLDVHIMDWKGGLPDYIKWLHRAGIDCASADEYTAGHIIGFLVREVDVIMCPALEGIEKVYMVYRDRRPNVNAL